MTFKETIGVVAGGVLLAMGVGFLINPTNNGGKNRFTSERTQTNITHFVTEKYDGFLVSDSLLVPTHDNDYTFFKDSDLDDIADSYGTVRLDPTGLRIIEEHSVRSMKYPIEKSYALTNLYNKYKGTISVKKIK